MRSSRKRLSRCVRKVATRERKNRKDPSRQLHRFDAGDDNHAYGMELAGEYKHGVDHDQSKLSQALGYENQIIAGHPGLRSLTGVERENMARVFYGGYGSSNLTKQYHAASCSGGRGGNCNGGTWVWVVNSAGNAGGVQYVGLVRGQTPQC